MTTLLAGRLSLRYLVRDLLTLLRSLIVADAAGDASSTRFSWPRGL